MRCAVSLDSVPLRRTAPMDSYAKTFGATCVANACAQEARARIHVTVIRDRFARHPDLETLPLV